MAIRTVRMLYCRNCQGKCPPHFRDAVKIPRSSVNKRQRDNCVCELAHGVARAHNESAKGAMMAIQNSGLMYINWTELQFDVPKTIRIMLEGLQILVRRRIILHWKTIYGWIEVKMKTVEPFSRNWGTIHFAGTSKGDNSLAIIDSLYLVNIAYFPVREMERTIGLISDEPMPDLSHY